MTGKFGIVADHAIITEESLRYSALINQTGSKDRSRPNINLGNGAQHVDLSSAVLFNPGSVDEPNSVNGGVFGGGSKQSNNLKLLMATASSRNSRETSRDLTRDLNEAPSTTRNHANASLLLNQGL